MEFVDDFENRSNEFNAAYGEFAFNFEHVCSVMVKIIKEIFIKKGLDRDTNLVDILTYDSTAYPLMNYLKGSLKEFYSVELMENEKAKEYLNLIINRIQKAAEIRNNLIHSKWIMSYSSDRNDVALGTKSKISKNGFESKVKLFKAEQFKKLADELAELKEILKDIRTRIDFDMDFYFEGNVFHTRLADLKFETPKN